MTFRYKNELRDSANINVSFYNNEVIKQIDSLQISNGTHTTTLKDLKYMFAQRRRNDYNLRFNNRAALKGIYSLFANNQWTVRLYTQGKIYVYTPTKSTKKAIPSLNTHIFSTF